MVFCRLQSVQYIKYYRFSSSSGSINYRSNNSIQEKFNPGCEIWKSSIILGQDLIFELNLPQIEINVSQSPIRVDEITRNGFRLVFVFATDFLSSDWTKHFENPKVWISKQVVNGENMFPYEMFKRTKL